MDNTEEVKPEEVQQEVKAEETKPNPFAVHEAQLSVIVDEALNDTELHRQARLNQYTLAALSLGPDSYLWSKQNAEGDTPMHLVFMKSVLNTNFTDQDDPRFGIANNKGQTVADIAVKYKTNNYLDLSKHLS